MMNNQAEEDKATAAKAASAQDTGNKPNERGKRFPRISLILLVVIIIGCCLLGYFTWQWLQQHNKQQLGNIQQLQQAQTNMHKMIEQQQKMLADQQVALSRIARVTSNSDQQWGLAEAEYLIQLANYTARFEHNIPLALQLLEMSNNKVAAQSDPRLTAVRVALKKNISALKGIAKLDLENILIQLDQLSGQVRELPIAMATLTRSAELKKQTSNEQSSAKLQQSWRAGLQKSLDQLKQLIVIQYHPKIRDQLIKEDDRIYIDQHMQSLLNQANWAAIHRKNKLYHASLSQAIAWLKKYYVVSSQQALTILSELEQLNSYQLLPSIPDISAPLRAIQAARQENAATERE